MRAERYRLRERPVPPRGAWSARYSWGTFRGMRLNRNVENTSKAPHFAGNVVPSRAIASHEFRSGSPIHPSPDFGLIRLRHSCRGHWGTCEDRNRAGRGPNKCIATCLARRQHSVASGWCPGEVLLWASGSRTVSGVTEELPTPTSTTIRGCPSNQGIPFQSTSGNLWLLPLTSARN